MNALKSPEDIPIVREAYNVIRSRAPLRISFCGGGTDVPPYPERYGGCVLSATIDKYAYVSVRAFSDDRIQVHSEDLAISATFDPQGGAILSGKLDLAQAIFQRFKTTAVECLMHSDAPPGSGLGSSSAMIVALITAMARSKGMFLSPYDVAELACAVERTDLKIIGGYQDQYACTFGGFNFIEFSAEGAFVTPLRLTEDQIAELHYHLILCYTGSARVSGNILQEQTANVTTENGAVMDSLAQIKDMTIEMKRLLLKGKLLEFGDILDQSWAYKRKLASNISNGVLDEFYAAAKSAGALGGKILGAGGGGYLLAFTPFNKRQKVRQRLEQLGGRVVEFQFEDRGARSWPVPNNLWT